MEACKGILVDFRKNVRTFSVMDEKRARGRPPKGEGSQTARIYLRAEPTEKERYEKAAHKAGVSLAEWMKQRLNRAAAREIAESE